MYQSLCSVTRNGSIPREASASSGKIVKQLENCKNSSESNTEEFEQKTIMEKKRLKKRLKKKEKLNEKFELTTPKTKKRKSAAEDPLKAKNQTDAKRQKREANKQNL